MTMIALFIFIFLAYLLFGMPVLLLGGMLIGVFAFVTF